MRQNVVTSYTPLCSPTRATMKSLDWQGLQPTPQPRRTVYTSCQELMACHDKRGFKTGIRKSLGAKFLAGDKDVILDKESQWHFSCLCDADPRRCYDAADTIGIVADPETASFGREIAPVITNAGDAESFAKTTGAGGEQRPVLGAAQRDSAGVSHLFKT